MNGKKYKVTIRVVDHPPRYCDNWKAEQKMSGVSPDDTIAKEHLQEAEKRHVRKNCVTFCTSDKKEKIHKDDFTDYVSGGDYLYQTAEANGRTADRYFEGTSKQATSKCQHHSEDDRRRECNETPLRPKKTTSLNIYKFARSNAIDEHDRNWSSPGGEDAGITTESPEPFSSVKQEVPQRFLCSDINYKHDFRSRKNGYNVSLPVVILNSLQDSERTIFPTSSVGSRNMGDGLTSDFFASGLDRRPRLNREGSTCSTDSVITEIEGLTDEESEEVCSRLNRNQNAKGVPDEECGPKTNNWKKIRGMIHWTPFAKHYKKKYPWVQLAGHQGNFKAGEPGTILKKTNDVEKQCLTQLMKDVLRPFVPEFKREVENHDEYYLVMQDLLHGFDSPSVMDCKMGVRTFLEDELEKAKQQPKLRKDLYQKMIDVDPNAPTEEERRAGGICKPRYMKWREELSSSSSLGFRIEGIKKGGEKPNKDFKTTRSKEEVGEKFKYFINNDAGVKLKYLQRLKAIRGVLESSSFFKVHEVIGSSLLFVHDCQGNVNIWMIDFAKTRKVADGIQLTHREKWTEGNHEDGYLFGLDNMISIWSNM